METELKDPAAANLSRATLHTRSRYDRMAPLYDFFEGAMERGKYSSWREELWQQVKGPVVLELGVGTGKNIPYYPQGIEVTAIDLSPKMLERARSVAREHGEKQVTLREMDAERLHYPDDSFDDTVATFVFCSVPDPVQGLREALRVTRPGGRLLLLEHMLSSHAALAPVMKALDPVIHYVAGVHIARRTVENVRKAGWAIDRVTPLDSFDIFRTIEASKR
jgi:ubiquinone/menaquinone biosynthesis C-methylase UbiE